MTLRSSIFTCDIIKRHPYERSEEERLATAVPRAVILYRVAVIKTIIADLTEKLKSENNSEEQQSELLHQISILNDERRKISAQIERPVL